jgi:hypothetical protein
LQGLVIVAVPDAIFPHGQTQNVVNADDVRVAHRSYPVLHVQEPTVRTTGSPITTRYASSDMAALNAPRSPLRQ